MNLSTNVKTYFGKAEKFIIDVFFPKICAVCGEEGTFLCKKCAEGLPLFKYPLCPNPACQKKLIFGRVCENCRQASGLTRFFAALPYQDKTTREMLWQFKYLGAKDLAFAFGKILTEFLAKCGFESIFDKKKTILVPVPLFQARLKDRGFNQSEEIAKIIGEYFKIPARIDILAKIKDTAAQAEIKSPEQKQKNILGVFSCKNPDAVLGKIVILIDDVYTTGSTMKECARVLRASGAKEIWGITIARG